MNLRNRLKLLFCCICLTTASFAQQLNHVLGDILIKSNETEDIQTLFRQLHSFEGQSTDLQIERIADKPMNIWLLQFDFTKIHEARFLKYLKSLPSIEIAQYNHLIKPRQIPNDPLFAQQWQYINTGLAGGLEGCDLDAEAAWDITTGGVTVTGDTIVVCVIDGGVDLDHEDLVDNLWRNHAEIPDNGIDDDGNGFEDDVIGWNAAQDNDNVGDDSHGTAVAGIIGAKGNNNIGVSGVNWDVKLMIVEGGSSNEAQVLKAYAYPLALRKQYNETSGEKGAFVVATNASWGTDFGQAEDAPLWCAFYDSLGVAGVLNCGATINGNTNVDEEGDLPTTCTSDYLISVTNLDRTCTKVTNAGYGATHIDLGAFGEDAYTTRNGNNYTGFGGTSGATPHVAGTIALMYAAPCEALASLASNDPAAAALLVKQYILEGVVPNESLEGITVTEGILNMNNSLQMVMDNCSACPLPSSVQAVNITDQSAAIIWVPSGPSESVTIQYRALGTTNWTTFANIASDNFTIPNLEACTDYEYQIATNCATETSGVSNFFSFKTDGCCDPPNGFQTLSSTEFSIDVSWNSVLAATGGYTLRYRAEGTENWSLLTATNTELTIENLASCTNYEMQVRSTCNDGPTAYGNSVFMFTKGCGACAELDYCPSKGNDSSDEWIEMVELADLNNISGNNEGFADFTHLSATLSPGEEYNFTITPGYDGNAFFDYYKIWIDYNQDGDFEDDGELVFDPGMPTNMAISGTFKVPTDAPFGNARMRVTMKWTGSNSGDLPPTACETAFNYGEVEDYCIAITQPDAVQTPTSITNIDLSPNPFSEAFLLQFDLKKATDLQFILTDIQGRTILKQTASFPIGKQVQTFSDFQNVPSGIYLLSMLSADGVVTKKVVKE